MSDIEITEAVAIKAEVLAKQPQGVIKIPGQIYRVRGVTDRYLVSIPSDTDLLPVCTCMAAKVHPDVMCKHIGAVLLRVSGTVTPRVEATPKGQNKSPRGLFSWLLWLLDLYIRRTVQYDGSAGVDRAG